MNMLPGMGDWDPPEQDPPERPKGPGECSGCRHEFDHDSRPVNDETGRCTTCDPWYCYRCANVVVQRNDQACPPCAATTCTVCENETKIPGLGFCRDCAVLRADSLAVDLHQAGEDLALEEARVANLTAEIEELRTERQAILDAIHNHETEKPHAA